MAAVYRHYSRRRGGQAPWPERDPGDVREALNALALVIQGVLDGAGRDPAHVDFFYRALGDPARRLEDLIRADVKWSCGHVGGGQCAKCFRRLARRAHELAKQVDDLTANRPLAPVIDVNTDGNP
jgi:hypothetical protein